MTWSEWSDLQRRLADRERMDQIAAEAYVDRVRLDCERDPELAWRMRLVDLLSEMGFRYEWDPDAGVTSVASMSMLDARMRFPDSYFARMMDVNVPPEAVAHLLAAAWYDERLNPCPDIGEDDCEEAA